MFRLYFYLFVVALSSITVLGVNVVTPQKPELIDITPVPINARIIHQKSLTDTSIVPETTTTESSKTTTSTTLSTTTSTTPPTTTSTTPPTTTSTTPPTTTSTTPPTTTSTTTTSTTSKTTTTPPPKPTPTPKPGPPQRGNWSFTDAQSNVTCILIQFAAQFKVTYPNSTSDLASVILNVPNNATVVDGNCNGTEQSISLSWPTGDGFNTMVLVFQSNKTTKNYALKSLNVSLAPEVFYDSQFKDPVDIWHAEEWQTPLATSYRCEPPSQLAMTAELKNVAATLTLAQLQEEAFRTTTNKIFNAARECAGADVPDAVPIAVGCALGGLVVVVLVAYLVGRRRSAARGYLSM